LIVGFGILFLTATAIPRNDRNILEQDRIYHNASGPGGANRAGGAVSTADIVAQLETRAIDPETGALRAPTKPGPTPFNAPLPVYEQRGGSITVDHEQLKREKAERVAEAKRRRKENR